MEFFLPSLLFYFLHSFSKFEVLNFFFSSLKENYIFCVINPVFGFISLLDFWFLTHILSLYMLVFWSPLHYFIVHSLINIDPLSLPLMWKMLLSYYFPRTHWSSNNLVCKNFHYRANISLFYIIDDVMLIEPKEQGIAKIKNALDLKLNAECGLNTAKIQKPTSSWNFWVSRDLSSPPKWKIRYCSLYFLLLKCSTLSV